jgi:hypothetical protein
MPFDNPLLAKLFEGLLEGHPVRFRNDLMPPENIVKATELLPLSLSRQQREAVCRAWMNEISYIQGPPGTGKSHTITAIMLSALFLKKRVLLVSHKKPAIDVVYTMLSRALGSGCVMYASNESAQRQQIRGELQQWLSRQGTLDGRREAVAQRKKREACQASVEKFRAEVAKLEMQIKNALDWEKEYYERQEEFHRNRQQHFCQFGLDSAGARFSRTADCRKALYILEQMEQLVGEELQESNGKLPRKKILALKAFLNACVKSFFARPRLVCPTLASLQYLKNHLELTEGFQKAEVALARVLPDYLSQARQTLLRKQESLKQQRACLAKHWMSEHIVSALENSSDETLKFRSMIHHSNATLIRQKLAGIDFKKLIDTFPLWVGQMRHLGEFLPFRPDLFDLIIVDEASQVNIAEIVPAFYRGSRICVVGDDKQLGLNAAGLFSLNKKFEELIWSKHFPGSKVSYSQAEQRSLLVSKNTSTVLRF